MYDTFGAILVPFQLLFFCYSTVVSFILKIYIGNCEDFIATRVRTMHNFQFKPFSW